MSTPYNLQTRSGCLSFIADRRNCARIVNAEWTRKLYAARAVDRQRRLWEKSGNPMLKRRAEHTAHISKGLREEAKVFTGHIEQLADDLFNAAPLLDHFLPRDDLLAVLNVNTADRADIKPDDGIIEIVFARALESSATYRDHDWERSPLHEACMLRLQRELLNNAALRRSADEMLFGKGGMMEFVPRGIFQTDGTFKRLPPPLRLADECDAQGGKL